MNERRLFQPEPVRGMPGQPPERARPVFRGPEVARPVPPATRTNTARVVDESAWKNLSHGHPAPAPEIVHVPRAFPEKPVDAFASLELARDIENEERPSLESFIVERMVDDFDTDGQPVQRLESNRAGVERDAQYVQRFEDLFEADLRALEDSGDEKKIRYASEQREAKELSEAMEVAIHDRINQDSWFGEHVHSRLPTKLDDIRHKVDIILELSDEVGVRDQLALGVDVTFSAESTLRKLQNIREQIDRYHNLGFVKYYRQGSKVSTLEDVPRAVISFSPGDAGRLVRDWTDDVAGSDDNRKLILLQLELQLDAFGAYVTRGADLPDRKRDRFTRSYDSTLTQVEEIGHGVVSTEDRVRLLGDPRIKFFKEQLSLALSDTYNPSQEVPAVAA